MAFVIGAPTARQDEGFDPTVRSPLFYTQNARYVTYMEEDTGKLNLGRAHGVAGGIGNIVATTLIGIAPDADRRAA